MLRVVNPSDQLIASRLVELFDPATTWHRALWGLGMVLTLREILEATEARRAGSLSDKSVERLGASALRMMGTDPGVSAAEKQALSTALKGSPRFDGLSYHTISQLADRIADKYLPRWSTALGLANQPQPERAARSIAAHLLDLGFSGHFLHSWWTERLYRDTGQLSLSELCSLAHSELALSPLVDFEVLVAFKNAPRSASGYPNSWLGTKPLIQWLREHTFEVANVRASGGVVLTISAHDGHAAAELAADRLDQFVARSSIATTEPLVPWPTMWVAGEQSAFPVGHRPRGVRVKALYREDQIFAHSASSVDAAIELIAHLENSSASAAIAGGWAAIEALLAEPDDRAAVAESLAAIVACSFPRAELTVLSYRCESLCPDLAADLQASTENRDRALVIAKAIATGHTLNLRRPSDKAALRRMQQLAKSPAKYLLDLQNHIADAFSRLYRQRNMILHGGKTNGIALRGSLRTSAKLVGAGMDRITHAWYVKGVRPIELAARARASILLASEHDVSGCVDLLGV